MASVSQIHCPLLSCATAHRAARVSVRWRGMLCCVKEIVRPGGLSMPLSKRLIKVSANRLRSGDCQDARQREAGRAASVDGPDA